MYIFKNIGGNMDKKNLTKLALLGLVVASSGASVVNASEGNSAQGTLLAGKCGGGGKCGGVISMEDTSNYNRSSCGGTSHSPTYNGRAAGCGGSTGPSQGTYAPQSGCRAAQPTQGSTQSAYYKNSACNGQTYRYTADNTTQQRNAQNNAYNTNRNVQDTQSEYYNNPNTTTERYYNTNPSYYNADYNRANTNQYPQGQYQQPVNPSMQPKSTSRGY